MSRPPSLRRHGVGPIVAILLALAAGAGPADAQVELSGRVLEEGTGNGVEGALVQLLAPDSSRLGSVLSGPGGGYVLRVGGPGRYRLRVLRMGYAITLSPLVDVGPRGRTLDVRLPLRPVELAPIVATGRGRCVARPEQGSETAVLWEEARKVLEVTALVHREGLLRFEVLRFVRDLSPDREVLRAEGLDVAIISNPFRSPDAETLVRDGFVQPDGEESVFYMPDPDVVLSDAFLSSHCFHVEVRGTGGGRQVGLAFEPTPGRRTAEVQGVLWLDGASGELRSLEYGYVGLADPLYEAAAGGTAFFEQLSSGVWVVRRWWISMPHVEKRSSLLGLRTRYEMTAVRDEGGELIEAYTPEGRLLTRPGAHGLEGVVRTALQEPLPGAVVRLSGTLHVDTAGPGGRFRFGHLPAGRYLLTFEHPLQDTLGVFPRAWPVDVPDGGELVLTTPSRAEVLADACPDLAREGDGGVVTGQVTDAQGRGIPGARVEGEYVGTGRSFRGRTGDDGLFRFCGVRPDRPLELAAEHEGRRSSRQTVRVSPRGFRRVVLVVGEPG